MTPTPIEALKDLVELWEQLDSTKEQLRADMGSLLQQMRRERGLSLRMAAKLLACDFSNLRRLEQGITYSPSIVEMAIRYYPTIPLSATVLSDDEPELITTK